jgi:hypothetical protein
MVGIGDYYKAMMKLHPLIAYEAQLLNLPPQEWRRASQRDPETARSPNGPQQGSIPVRFPAPARAPTMGGSRGFSVAAQ